MTLFENIKPLINAHYISNIFLAALYFILKHTPKACMLLFRTCQLELREYEWLTFLACIVVLKNRKQGDVGEYVSTACLFTKTLSVICFSHYSLTYSMIYILLCFAHVMFLPKPVYKGPEDIVYFRGPNLCDEIRRDKSVTWLITFFVAWSPKCVTFAPVFSQLSNEYALDNLKFGKIDVSRYPDIAEKYKINTGALSRQLPTMILFKDGIEKERRPIPTKHMTMKFDFNKDNVVKEFQLNDVYYECKKSLPAKKKTDENKKEK